MARVFHRSATATEAVPSSDTAESGVRGRLDGMASSRRQAAAEVLEPLVHAVPYRIRTVLAARSTAIRARATGISEDRRPARLATQAEAASREEPQALPRSPIEQRLRRQSSGSAELRSPCKPSFPVLDPRDNLLRSHSSMSHREHLRFVRRETRFDCRSYSSHGQTPGL